MTGHGRKGLIQLLLELIDRKVDNIVLKVYCYIGMWILVSVLGMFALSISVVPVIAPVWLVVAGGSLLWLLLYLLTPAAMVFTLRITWRILQVIGVDED